MINDNNSKREYINGFIIEYLIDKWKFIYKSRLFIRCF